MMKMLPKVPKQYIAQTHFLFNCHIKIKIPIEYKEEILDECFAIYEAIDLKYNSYQIGSYFDQINIKTGQWVEVDEECIKMLKVILQVCELSNGAYDITCMPLLRLWGFYDSNKKTAPTLSEIKDCLQLVNYQNVIIKDTCVMIGEGQEIITGSFIKAFATDEVKKYLISKGIKDAIINAGGSTILALNDDCHKNWTINIPNPFSTENDNRSIPIGNKCFSLSGRKNNNITLDGKSYGHILNSVSGFPSSTLQVGVLSDSAFVGDVISTALFTLEENEIDSFLEKLETNFEVSVFRIEENNKKYSTNAFNTVI